MLSDGEDTSSLVTYDEVLDLAKRSETAIYTIGLRDRGGAGRRKGFQEADFVLRRPRAGDRAAARSSPSASRTWPASTRQIADELASQYTVGYVSKNAKRDGAWRRIVVRVARAEAHGPDQAGLLRAAAR